MKPFLYAAMTFGICAATFPAIAQMRGAGGGNPLAVFATADADHDGKVSREEYANTRDVRFAMMDRNGDGVISKADFAEILAERPQAAERIEQTIAAGDSDKDGKISKAEWHGAPMPIFDRLDANGDGFVDKAEVTKARAMMEARQRDPEHDD